MSDNNIAEKIGQKAAEAKKAAGKLAIASSKTKNEALLAMAAALIENSAEILKANAEDVTAAKEKNLKTSYIDRLTLNDKRIEQMAEGLRQTAALPDPVGEGDLETLRPNGLNIRRVRVPLGVIGIIYEARPNVTADAMALCLKSGNACLLRGGSEALKSNLAIFNLLNEAAVKAGIPQGAMQFAEFTDREAVGAMGNCRGLIDAIIPRGGAGLIKYCAENSKVRYRNGDRGLPYLR